MTEAQVTALTGAVSFSTIITGLLAVGAAVAVVYVAMKGITMLVNFLRRA